MQSTDVDLEAALADKSEEEQSSGASAEIVQPESDVSPAADETAPDAEPSERAQERIRALVEEVNRLKEASNVQNSTDLDKFINSIQDEPSRNLLKTYGSLLEKRLREEINPLKEDYSATKFEKEFSQFAEKIPELADHKEDLRKTYMRDPSVAIKSLIGETLVEIQTAKIKPIESDSSAQENRENRTDLNAIDDKDELYALLESNKGKPVS